MGLRVRLKSTFDISKFSPSAQVILKALKTYGMIVADNGSNWFISVALPTFSERLPDISVSGSRTICPDAPVMPSSPGPTPS